MVPTYSMYAGIICVSMISVWSHWRLISRLSLAMSRYLSSSLKNDSLFPLFSYPSLGRFRVTTPIDPVESPAPNRPPLRWRSSDRSSRRRQHIERTSEISRSLLMKFAKYGVPYLPAISHSISLFGFSQSKRS